MTFSPVKVCEVELSEPVAGITAAGLRLGPGTRPLVLRAARAGGRSAARRRGRRGPGGPGALAVRRGEQVTGTLLGRAAPAGRRRSAAALQRAGDVRAAAGRPARFRGPGHGLSGPEALRTAACGCRWPPAYLLGRAATLRNAPPASVIICTRDRAERLDSCLTAVLRQDYPDFEVIVVDNAPASDAVADLVARRNAAGHGRRSAAAHRRAPPRTVLGAQHRAARRLRADRRLPGRR